MVFEVREYVEGGRTPFGKQSADIAAAAERWARYKKAKV
jgi:hypothetical protein